MDTSFTVKPRDNLARPVVGRGNIVRTDLSPSQSVNAAQNPSASHYSPDAMMRDPSLDPQCHAVLDRERERLLLQFYNLELAIGKQQANIDAITRIQPLPPLTSLSRNNN